MDQPARRDEFLNEALIELDLKFQRARFDVNEALASLTSSEVEFITGEIARCKYDTRYYLENYHVIQDEMGQLRTLFPFWDSQEIFLKQVFDTQSRGEPVYIIVLKARQLGLSTVSQGLLFQKTIYTQNCNTLIVAQDEDQASYLTGMSRLAYDKLPWWMRPEKRYDSKKEYLVFDRKDDMERLINPGLRSNIWIESAVKTTGVAVGKTLRCAHMSELSLWGDAKLLTKMIWPSLNATDGLYIMESTARGRAHWWFPLWQAAVKGELDRWQPCFIEFFRVNKYTIPLSPAQKLTFTRTEEESALCERVANETKVVITDETLEWRRRKIATAIAAEGDEWGFYQEYPSHWMEAFQASGLCAFNKKKLHSLFEMTCKPPTYYGEIYLKKDPRTGRKLNKSCDFRGSLRKLKQGEKPPLQQNYGGRLRIWDWPEPNTQYYIGADVAQGIKGGDYSVAQVFKVGKGRNPDVQVAEWHGHINPYEYAEVLAALGNFYYGAGLACEANEVGRSTNGELFRVYEYENMYRFKNPDKFTNLFTDFFGWYTNHKNRQEIIAKFRAGLDEDTIILRSADLVDQAFDFASQDGGKYEGQEGHDDRVMSAMIAYYCAHDMDWAQVEDEPRVRPDNDHIGADFYNTDYSPLHEYKQGLRYQMMQRGDRKPEEILYSELEGAIADKGEVDWRTL